MDCIPADDAFDFPGAFPRSWAVMQAGLEAGLHLGGQVYISVHGKPVAHIAFGWAREGREMKRESLALWLSAGKPLTAVAVMQCVERGETVLEARVSEILPAFGVKGKENLTIRHLLTHTAGLRSADDPVSCLSWQAQLERICQAPLEPDWVPGATAGYQLSATWLVLAELVQRLSGQAFPDYLRKRVCAPLALKDTWVAIPEAAIAERQDRLAWLYVTQSGRVVPHPFWSTPESFAVCQPGASARGPIHELGRFYEAMLAGGGGDAGRVLEPETVVVMTSPQRVGLNDRTFQHRLDWGLGFIVNSNHYGLQTVPYGFGLHASPRAFGHGGAQSSIGFADPECGLTVAWHLNGQCGEPRHQRRNRALNTAIYEDLGITVA